MPSQGLSPGPIMACLEIPRHLHTKHSCLHNSTKQVLPSLIMLSMLQASFGTLSRCGSSSGFSPLMLQPAMYAGQSKLGQMLQAPTRAESTRLRWIRLMGLSYFNKPSIVTSASSQPTTQLAAPDVGAYNLMV